MLMGLGDWATALAVYSSIAVTVFGVIYGAIHWNEGNDALNAAPALGKSRRGRRRKRR